MRPGGNPRKGAGGKSSPAQAEQPSLITSRGWRFVALGAVLVVAGCALLSRTDAAGANAASIASPLFLLCGYGFIAFATIAREKS